MSENMARSLTMEVSAKPKGNAKDAFRPLEDAAAESGKKISNSLSESQDAVLKKIKSVEERLGKIGSGMKLGEDIFEKAFGLSNVDKVMGKVKGQIEFQMRDLQRVAMKLTPEMDARPLEMTLRRLEGQVKQFAGLTKQGLSDAFSSFGRASGGLQSVLVGTSILGSGDQSIEAIIAKMLKVNAVFDVIKGGKEIISGLVGGFINAGKAASVFQTATALSQQMGQVSAVVTERLRGEAVATDQLTGAIARNVAVRRTAAGLPIATPVGASTVGTRMAAGIPQPAVPAPYQMGMMATTAWGIGGGMVGGSLGYGLGGDLGGVAGGLLGTFGAPALASKAAGAGIAGIAAAAGTAVAGILALGAGVVLVNDKLSGWLGEFLPAATESAAALKRMTEAAKADREMRSGSGYTRFDFGSPRESLEANRPFRDRQDQVYRDRFDARESVWSAQRRSTATLGNLDLATRREGLSDVQSEFFRNPNQQNLNFLLDSQTELQRMQATQQNPELAARREALENQMLRAQQDEGRFNGLGRLRELGAEEGRLGGNPATPPTQRISGYRDTGSFLGVNGNFIDMLEDNNPLSRLPGLSTESGRARRQNGSFNGYFMDAAIFGTNAALAQRAGAFQPNQAPGQNTTQPSGRDQERRLGELRSEQARLREGMGIQNLPSGLGIEEATRRQGEALNRVRQVQDQINALEREERQVRMQNLQATREQSKEMEKQAESAARSLRDQQRSNMSSFGLMDETDQLRTLDIQQRLAQGGIGTLSRDEISFAQGSALLRPNLEQYGLDQARNSGLYQQIERLTREGVTSVPDQLANLDRLAQQSRETRVRVENEIRMQVTAEPEEVSRVVTERLVPIFDRLVDRIAEQMAQNMARLTAEDALRRQQQVGADASRN